MLMSVLVSIGVIFAILNFVNGINNVHTEIITSIGGQFIK
jgi:hypothetical protein